MKTQYPPIRRIILFGGSVLLWETTQFLKKQKIDFHIYTSPRHLEEPLDETGLTLQSALQSIQAPFVSTENINQESSLLPLIDDHTLGIGMGEAWSFDRGLIERFRGRLLDFMGIPLPRYRGGAHYTWMILRGDREWACHLQVINEDMVQGEVDTGELVKSKTYSFPLNARIPMDYFRAAVREEVAFIQEFLNEVQAGKKFELRKPDENQSLFFPRLNTQAQGWINWTWSGEEIEKFICAFDEPYAGASTLINGQRVYLKDCTLDTSEKSFHPFQTGLITRMTPQEGLVIATRSGHLKVKKAKLESGQSALDQLKPGDRLFTPSEKLESALLYRAHYGSSK